MSFKKDLEFGKIYEKKYCELRQFQNYKISEGRFSEYDIIDYDTNTTYEVKSDRLAFKSLNLAIEFKNNKKETGISVTTSNYYIYFVVYPNNNFDYFEIPTQELKDIIKNNTFPIGKTKYGTEMYLIPFEQLNVYLKK